MALNLVWAGLAALQDYIALHVLTCLIPAFLLAGAMVAFIDKQAIMIRLGAAASKPASFATATGASFFLAACSCTVIPVSGGIYYSGAGIGAAFILLWVAPASNLLSLIYTGNILGAEMIWARVITAVAMAAVVGTIMTVVFRREEAERMDLKETGGQATIIARKDLALLGLLPAKGHGHDRSDHGGHGHGGDHPRPDHLGPQDAPGVDQREQIRRRRHPQQDEGRPDSRPAVVDATGYRDHGA